MSNSQDSNIKQFTLVKFQPSNILLVNKYTKEAFNYFEILPNQSLSQQLNHPTLSRPLVFNTGLLYPKGESTLKIQLDNRRRAFNQLNFTQQELKNTFASLFDCIKYLHTNDIIHGQIHPSNIVVINQQIKMRDWLIKSSLNSFYFKKEKKNITKEDDYIALGQILMQCATLRKSDQPFNDQEVDLAIQSILDLYSKGFIFSLLILLKKKKQLFKDICSLLENDSSFINNLQLNDLYTKAKIQKSKKSIKIQPIEKIVNLPPSPLITQKNNQLIQISPTKKFNITTQTPKKVSKMEDTQNKKVFNQQVKKRQIQKITKIIQRSNAFVNELMARKNNDQVLKKISGKSNININLNTNGMGSTMSNMAMYGVETKKTKQKQLNGTTMSPNKRMRTISRKK